MTQPTRSNRGLFRFRQILGQISNVATPVVIADDRQTLGSREGSPWRFLRRVQGAPAAGTHNAILITCLDIRAKTILIHSLADNGMPNSIGVAPALASSVVVIPHGDVGAMQVRTATIATANIPAIAVDQLVECFLTTDYPRPYWGAVVELEVGQSLMFVDQVAASASTVSIAWTEPFL